MKRKFRCLLLLVISFVLSVSANAEDFMIGGWTLFFGSHMADQCVVFENQKGDSGDYTLHYAVFEGRGGETGEKKGKYKVYKDEKGRLIIKLGKQRICMAVFNQKGEKATSKGNIFDEAGKAMWGSEKLGDAKIEEMSFSLWKGKHTDPNTTD